MNKFTILVCDDNSGDQRNIKLHLSTIKRLLPDFDIDYKICDFEETYNELRGSYDLLLLDLFDEESDSNAGENILMHNKGNLQIPTVIYTSRGDSTGFDFNTKKIEFPFLREKLTKIHTSGENLIDFVKGLIIVNGDIRYYNLYNEHDEGLVLSIKLIGQENFNYILYNIREKYDKKDICVYPMTSGLSGAILFKLEIDSAYYILKLSRDITELKEEHENGIKLYHQFPSHLINHISSEEYYSFGNNVLGILIKNVEGSQTFFNFLSSCGSGKHNDIEQFLSDLYLDEQALSSFFKVKKGSKTDWTSIFSKIDDRKMALIKRSFHEVKPIIVKYYKDFDFEDFKRLTISFDYRGLSRTALLGDQYSSELILSHGDFHSKNILVQGVKRPVIIDTGAIGYQHWSLDYCRLIVHIFINGIDHDSVEYFDLSEIAKCLAIVEDILSEKTIAYDGPNDNFITAINWLVSHYNDIFSDVNRFEFQLGLLKEFLQVAYRFDTVVPSKRAIAIIAAHKCMLSASGLINAATNN